MTVISSIYVNSLPLTGRYRLCGCYWFVGGWAGLVGLVGLGLWVGGLVGWLVGSDYVLLVVVESTTDFPPVLVVFPRSRAMAPGRSLFAPLAEANIWTLIACGPRRSKVSCQKGSKPERRATLVSKEKEGCFGAWELVWYPWRRGAGCRVESDIAKGFCEDLKGDVHPLEIGWGLVLERGWHV